MEPPRHIKIGRILVTFMQLYKPNGPKTGLPWVWASPDCMFAVGPFASFDAAKDSAETAVRTRNIRITEKETYEPPTRH